MGRLWRLTISSIDLNLCAYTVTFDCYHIVSSSDSDGRNRAGSVGFEVALCVIRCRAAKEVNKHPIINEDILGVSHFGALRKDSIFAVVLKFPSVGFES